MANMSVSKRRKRKVTKQKLKPDFLYADRSTLNDLSKQAINFVEYMEMKNYSDTTVKTQARSLGTFIEWCNDRGIYDQEEIIRPVIERYQKHLFYFRKKDNTPLSFRTQKQRLIHLKSFFSYMCKKHILLNNPTFDLELPKIPKSLPRDVLTIDEVEKILLVPNTGSLLGIRDRAILETLYSTGMRRAEIVNLKLTDIDFDQGIVFICEGKGKKDRYIPIGKRAIEWIEKYLYDSRVYFVNSPDDGILFLTNSGTKFKPDLMGNLVRKIIDQAEIKKKGACHIFRHSFATLLLGSGADIRSIQKMMGHESLESTQIYTHVNVKKLKEIHDLYHPAKGSDNQELHHE